jgi:hypothetical protein
MARLAVDSRITPLGLSQEGHFDNNVTPGNVAGNQSFQPCRGQFDWSALMGDEVLASFNQYALALDFARWAEGLHKAGLPD